MLKEGDLGKEKDIAGLYVNKQGCTEFLLSHGDDSFEEIAENLRKSTFFSVLMDGFIEGVDPTKTMLLHLPEPEGITVNADEFKACLIKSLKLIDPKYSSEEVMKKFVSMCTDVASSNIGCNNSINTRLKEDYPYLVSFLVYLSPSEARHKGCNRRRAAERLY